MKSFRVRSLQAFAACIGVALSVPGLASAQGTGFVTGQAAHLVLGQNSFTSNNYGASNLLLGSPSGIAYANGTLWVIDSNRLGATPNNNRILRFSDVSTYPSLTDLPDIPGSVCGACRGSASLVLGQANFNTFTPTLTAQGLRNPTGIATDGNILAVADTDNNRVLIWLHLPTVNGQPADVVVGQPNFTSNAALSPSQTSLRAPSGVWIYNGKLFVADTFDNRVLIYNKIPTTNGAAADLVLGQASFTAFVQPDLSLTQTPPSASNMQTPVSVTTDGTRLFVSDLGQNRVLVWNSMPTTNGQAADLAIGQPNLTSSQTNNSFTLNSTAVDADNNPTNITAVLCQSTKTDAVTGTALYPARCAATLSYPRFAYSDGTHLYIADGGNDRVLIFNSFPTVSGARADIILGQPDEFSDNTGDNPDGTDAFENPSAIAYDGTNLYITDTFNRRVLVHTPGVFNIPLDAVRNAASLAIYATGSISFSGSVTANNTITIKIGCTGSAPDCTVTSASYVHTMTSSDTVATAVQDLVKQINKSDTNVTASYNQTNQAIQLTAKVGGGPGGNVTYSVSTNTGATVLGTTTGTTLNIYLENPTQVAPGTLIQITGTNLCDSTGSADFSQTYLPFSMNNCTLYVDGTRAPLLYVSPTQINAQIPYFFTDRTSTSLYLRTAHADGTVTATTPIAVTIVPQNPGLFAFPGNDPRPGIFYHASSAAFDIVDINGIPQAGDGLVISIGPYVQQYTGTVQVVQNTNTITGVNTAWTSDMVGGGIAISDGFYIIASVNSATSITLTTNYVGPTGNAFIGLVTWGGTNYIYNETATDTIATATQGMVNVINSAGDPYVYAVLNDEYNRFILYSYVDGPAGEGINVFQQNFTTSTNTAGANISATVYSAATCCDHPANNPVTLDDPAIPGEALYTFATGLGPANPSVIDTGQIYRGGTDYGPAVYVDSILVQGIAATPMNITPVPNSVGVYYVEFALNSGVSTNTLSQLTIAQQLFVSNVVTLPIVIPGTVLTPPVVTSVSPATGPLTGGNTITIYGTNFSNPSGVAIGGVAATNVAYINSTTLTAVVPASTTSGPASVIVTTPAGTNQPNQLYAYAAVPTVTAINPASGPIKGGTTVTITGTGFTGSSAVLFSDLPATSFTVVSDTTITAVTPPVLIAVTVPVTITTPGGNIATQFTYK